MVHIKKKRRRESTGFLKIIGVCISFALLIRLISHCGADAALSDFLTRIGENSDAVKKLVRLETPIAAEKRSYSEMVMALFKKSSPFYSAFSHVQHDKDTSESAESAFLSSLTPWVFSPPESSDKVFPIKAISINPISSNGYVNLGKIFLKNDSTKSIDLNSYLKADMPFALKGDGPHVLIVHTHGSEAYFPSGKYTYTPDDVERSSDKNYNVIRVGDEIEKILTANGISTVHDRNIYDSPSYNGSYTRTLNAISAQLKKTPSIKVILDIHRDAMTTKEGVKYKTSAKINGEEAAQIMLVMSTGESGLPHPDWQENLKFAVKLQCQIANKYPGLMRPINLRKERFNMHVSPGSMLVEVGTSANSMEEALRAIRPFSQELAALLKTTKR